MSTGGTPHRLGARPTLCVDFDGVIHSYVSGWTTANHVADPPTPGALDFLAEAIEYFTVAIYSTRSNYSSGIVAMKRWLKEHLIAHFGPERGEQVLDQIEWPTEKPPAWVTLDDRALTFTGIWPSMNVLLDFRPWNEIFKVPKVG